MAIHQMSVAYQPEEDRLLMRLRTHDAQLIELWFTRRMMARLWSPLQKAADAASLRGASRDATILPEAQDMMARGLRQRSREAADFSAPFDESFASRPMGEQPMLVRAADIQDGGADKPLTLRVRDARHREIAIDLGLPLLHNFLTLMEDALGRSEWGIQGWAGGGSPPSATSEGSPRLLN
jgi:hypothetical protein